MKALEWEWEQSQGEISKHGTSRSLGGFACERRDDNDDDDDGIPCIGEGSEGAIKAQGQKPFPSTSPASFATGTGESGPGFKC